MDAKHIKQLIVKGEGIEVEFKESRHSLPRSVYETICAFLNRKGGHILLGVKNDGKVTGIDPSKTQTILDTLAKDMNNPQVITPTFYLSAEVVDIDDEKVIYVYVPESSQPHNYKGAYYDRNEDGDFRLNNQYMITNLYVRKQESYSENRVFPYLNIDDFEEEQFNMVRKSVELNRADHPWANMTNEDILLSARMRLKDATTGREGYTLAAVLLFGKENTLASIIPHYKTDALCRIFNTDLYDDRDDIRCNLLTAYHRLLAFIRKHLPERAYIEGTQRISLREMIFREIVSNILLHREFSNAFPATLTIYEDSVVTENWNRPYMTGHILPENLKPHPKNPNIAHFFRQLGWAEELGSGIRNMYKYCPLYFNEELPIIEEGDIFRTTIKYNDKKDVGVNVGVNVSEEILRIIRNNQGLNGSAISKQIPDVTKRTVERYLSELKKEGIIEFSGAPKTGGYYIK